MDIREPSLGRIVGSVLDLVGRTCMVTLGAEPGAAEVCLKVEGDNPSGSVKDRPVLAMIRDAERRGVLSPGQAIVEASVGNTATSLAVIGRATGYHVMVVAPSDMPDVRRANLEILGVELVWTEHSERMSGAIAKADRMAREGAFVMRQFGNEAAVRSHEDTGAEIWDQCSGGVDGFVAGVGTGATISGCAAVLKARNPRCQVVAVEPAESPVLSGGKPGPHRIPGIGAGFVPGLLRRDLVDEVYPVPWWEAHEAVRELGRQAGLFCGPSTGAVLMAARALARRLGEGRRVVGIAADWGERNVEVLVQPRPDER
ncbi:MAG TPA: cysteine synthase family protein [Actinomycetota bacterium]|nr:cysteine synthase family protein [Actinomycetota bacterium]